MTMPQPAYTYCYVPVPETQRHAGLLPHCSAAWRKCSFRRGTYIKEEGSALCVFYTNSGG